MASWATFVFLDRGIFCYRYYTKRIISSSTVGPCLACATLPRVVSPLRRQMALNVDSGQRHLLARGRGGLRRTKKRCVLESFFLPDQHAAHKVEHLVRHYRRCFVKQHLMLRMLHWLCPGPLDYRHRLHIISHRRPSMFRLCGATRNFYKLRVGRV